MAGGAPIRATMLRIRESGRIASRPHMTGLPIESMDRLRDGFRHRGRDITRLEVFVDAAFAFAVTLLVISIDTIPDTVGGLVDAMKGVPAFGISLIMIALFWSAHARWSRRYGLDDAVTTVLSIAFVFVVLVYVYPLKMMFASFFGWITDGWLPFGLRLEQGYRDILLMFMVYGAAFATLRSLHRLVFSMSEPHPFPTPDTQVTG